LDFPKKVNKEDGAVRFAFHFRSEKRERSENIRIGKKSEVEKETRLFDLLERVFQSGRVAKNWWNALEEPERGKI